MTNTATRQFTLPAEYVARGLFVHVIEYDAKNVDVRFFKYFVEGDTAGRDAFVALFPKSNKVRATALSGDTGAYYTSGSVLANGTVATGNGAIVPVDKVTGEEIVVAHEDRFSDAVRDRSHYVLPFAEAHFRLISNGNTGEKNETAHKRLLSFLRNLDKQGITFVQRHVDFKNAQPELTEVIARFA